MEYSNFVPQGTTHRDIPSTCPAQYRDRIANLRAAQPVKRDASPKFRIGDRCKVAGEKGGVILKVTKVSPSGNIVSVQDTNGATYELTAGFLEQVTLTQVERFKVGDSVQVAGGGFVLKVIKASGNLLSIQDNTGTTYDVLADDFEKVERSFSVAVARTREPLSVESQPKLLMRAELRQRLFDAELRYSDDQPRDEHGRFSGGGGTSQGESAKSGSEHVAAAKAHMDAADKADQGDDRHSQDKANAHFKAAAAHLQAAGTHNSSGASQSQKDQASKAAQKSSALANVS